ncbi:hypothetical protein LTR56_026960 [Elasticomyces elasticus]|nr:hypothetical protein LTR56_026960 [Elasticomyces elasticus]KAK3615781.1 hypothetical protein LTR22_027301 [Elasticomyces elasticus]KAK4903034.1 hypothetical protein LTR49_026909 [Elasticomyces elasticus]KAK5737869.1 hypothetical protein LTS12_025759 [Elasticomyces elasticus]
MAAYDAPIDGICARLKERLPLYRLLTNNWDQLLATSIGSSAAVKDVSELVAALFANEPLQADGHWLALGPIERHVRLIEVSLMPTSGERVLTPAERTDLPFG